MKNVKTRVRAGALNVNRNTPRRIRVRRPRGVAVRTHVRAGTPQIK